LHAHTETHKTASINGNYQV